MAEVAKVPTVDQLVGSNLRALRLEMGLSQDALARRLRQAGVPWSRSTLAAAEVGGKKFDLGELALLCFALEQPPETFLEGEGWAQLQPECRMTVEALRRTYAGRREWRKVKSLDVEGPDAERRLNDWLAVLPESRQTRYKRIIPGVTPTHVKSAEIAARNEAERKAALKLDIEDPVEVGLAALALWDQSLTEERDTRVASLSSPGTPPKTLGALRGHVTRELLDQLEPVVRRADGRRRAAVD